MRIRASYTVENSVIIPLFTMIIVVMVILALDMHDEIVFKAAAFQGNMRIEQEELEGSGASECVADVTDYINTKTMRKTATAGNVKSTGAKVSVDDNNPREFIRKMRAVMKLTARN